MKKPLFVLFCCLSATLVVSDSFAQRFVRRSLERACVQAAQLDSELTDTTLYPTSLDRAGALELKSIRSWVSGFFPGTLWLLYGETQDPSWLWRARRRTAALAGLSSYERTHDLGFMVGCPVGLGSRLTGDKAYERLLVETSETLLKRFDPKVGLIRSWDNKNRLPDPYLVIIDNMMNLEMLFEASRLTGDPRFRDVAVAHANTTLRNHFRKDGSAYHIVVYDSATGRVREHRGGQGYSSSSAWARGQSWGLYGFTMCYRETGDAKYLKHAERIADFIMHHPNTPADRIPYWDYNAPDIPDAPRDASAAAVISSALFELSTLVPEDEGKKYFDYAETLLMNLSSDAYLAKKGTNGGFILMHSVGHLPADSEIDTPLNYADYYYLEAIGRYLSLRGLDPRRI